MVWVKRIGAVVGVLVVVVALFAGWVWFRSNSILNQTWDVERVRIEHPWPFDDGELAAVRAELLAKMPPVEVPEGEEPPPPTDPLIGIDRDELRRQRAVKRGALLATRLGCVECHGDDLGGKTIMDVPPVMGIIAPNLTLGKGGLPGEYSMDDFDRIVRHGVKRDNTTALMPSVDYQYLSNKEVSDLYAFMLSKPHVDREMPSPYWGPVMRTLVATGQVPKPSAFRIDHDRRPRQEPPKKAVSTEYGAHLTKVCAGCHREGYEGGPVLDGDPEWPPASNLTPHEDGLKGWTKEQFFTLMRSGTRPDGSKVDPRGMPWQTVGMLDDVETEAMWVYLQSLPPTPTGN